MENQIVKGSEIDKIEMFKTVKGIMIEFLKGYPAYIYWGIIEGRFEKGVGDKVRDILEQHGLIEVGRVKIGNVKEPPKYYRLTPRGIDFAVSVVNLEHSEKMLKYSKEMRKFTIAIIIIGGLTLLLSGLTFYFQFLR